MEPAAATSTTGGAGGPYEEEEPSLLVVVLDADPASWGAIHGETMGRGKACIYTSLRPVAFGPPPRLTHAPPSPQR